MSQTYEIDVMIEIAKHSKVKYEYDENEKILVCNRVLHTPFTYFFNYGYIPNTMSPDNDPLDAVVIMEDDLVPGCKIRCRVLGCLETSDCEGVDPKMILCPCTKVDPTYSGYRDISDVPEHTLNKIHYFFSHYKDLENKVVKVDGFVGREGAWQIYLDSLLPSLRLFGNIRL